MENTPHPQKPDFGKCRSCHRPAIKYSSGTPECQTCWTWRKHRAAEAKFWLHGINELFESEYGSGPDMNDIELWDRWGVRREVCDALLTLSKLAVAYQMLEISHTGSYTEVQRYRLEGETETAIPARNAEVLA